jgi:hypothetical protein
VRHEKREVEPVKPKGKLRKTWSMARESKFFTALNASLKNDYPIYPISTSPRPAFYRCRHGIHTAFPLWHVWQACDLACVLVFKSSDNPLGLKTDGGMLGWSENRMVGPFCGF